jgi:hypothetical protein
VTAVGPYGPSGSATPAVAVEPERRRKAWDIALSVVFLVLATLVGIVGAFFAFLGLAFIDYCPPGCSVDAAVNAQIAAVIGVVVIGIVGLIATIVLLVTRRRAWWVALLTLVLIIVALVLGWVGETIAVGT